MARYTILYPFLAAVALAVCLGNLGETASTIALAAFGVLMALFFFCLFRPRSGVPLSGRKRTAEMVPVGLNLMAADSAAKRVRASSGRRHHLRRRLVEPPEPPLDLAMDPPGTNGRHWVNLSHL
jgi:hypothetical protein